MFDNSQDDQQPAVSPPRRHPLEQPPPERPVSPPPAQPRYTLRLRGVRPLVAYMLIAVNVLVFVAGLIQPALVQEIFIFAASRSYEVLVLGEYHRLFTAMFLHANLQHLFFNMYALYAMGRILEPIFGHVRFSVIYLLGGLAGSVLSVVLGNPDPYLGVPSVGASGAVFALFGAEMVYLYRHRQIMGQQASQQLRSLLMLLGINLLIGISSWLGDFGIRIDNWAHLGGFLGGLAMTWLIGPVFAVRPALDQPYTLIAQDTNPLKLNLWKISLYVIVMVAVLATFSLRVR